MQQYRIAIFPTTRRTSIEHISWHTWRGNPSYAYIEERRLSWLFLFLLDAFLLWIGSGKTLFLCYIASLSHQPATKKKIPLLLFPFSIIEPYSSPSTRHNSYYFNNNIRRRLKQAFSRTLIGSHYCINTIIILCYRFQEHTHSFYNISIAFHFQSTWLIITTSLYFIRVYHDTVQLYKQTKNLNQRIITP